MGQHLKIPAFTEKDWWMVLAGLSYLEGRERGNWYDKRSAALYAKQLGQVNPLSFPPLSSDGERQLNDISAAYTATKNKIHRLRDALLKYESKNKEGLDKEIDDLLGGTVAPS